MESSEDFISLIIAAQREGKESSERRKAGQGAMEDPSQIPQVDLIAGFFLYMHIYEDT